MAVTIKDLRFSIYLNNADAKKAAIELQTQLQRVGAEMSQLSAEGKKDTPLYREKKKAYDEMTSSMEKNKLEAGLLSYSWKELSQLSKTMKADLKRMVPDSDDWKKLAADIKVVDNRIDELKGTSVTTQSSLSKMATGFNKFFGVVATGVAAFSGIIYKMNEFAEMRSKLESSKANLKALTGLDQKDIEWLTKQSATLSKQMDADGIRIKQSSQDIIDSMTIVGSQRPELLKNKEALLSVTRDAIKMSIASNDSLEASTEALTNTLNQFNLEGTDSTRIINAMAAGSKVGAATIPYLSQAIEKSGTNFNLMGISVEQSIGIIEGVAPKFKQAEMAGNSLDKVLMIMKEKQIGYKDGVFDFNEALLELEQRYAKGETAVGIFGREHAKMGEVLVQARPKILEFTKGVTDTNIALEQAAINSDTYAAREAQATNRINEAGMALSKNMNSIKLFMSEVFAGALEGLANVSGAAKSATDQFEDQSKKVVDLKRNIEPLLTRYDELATKTNKSASENDELKRIIKEVTAVMPGATTAVDQYGNAISISTGRVREFINAEVARYGVVNKKAIEENKDLLSEVEKDIIKSKKRIDEINKTGTYTTLKINKSTGEYDVIKATQIEIKAEQDKYQKLLQDQIGYNAEINRLSGATLKKQMDDAEAAQKLLDAKAAKEKAYYTMSKAELKKLVDANDELAKSVYEAKYPKLGGGDEKVAKQKQELDLITSLIDNAHTERLTKLKEAKVKENKTDVDFNNESVLEDKAYYQLKIDALEKYKNKVTDKNFKADIDKQIKELEDKKAEIDVKYQERINKILLDADPVKKENKEYDDRLTELGLFNKDRETMTKEELKVLELLETQHNDNLFRIRASANSEELKQNEKKFKDEYQATKDKYDEEINDLSKNASGSKKTNKSSLSSLSSIEKDPQIILIRKRIEAIKSETAAREKYGLDVSKLNKDLVAQENSITEVYISKYNERAKLFGNFGEQLGTAIGDLATGNKDALKSSLIAMINLGLDFLKGQAEMAIAGATVQSLASAESVATFGVAGLAKAALLTGLIEAAFAAAKTVIGNTINNNGKKEGGFTGGNNPNEVRGFLSNGEPVHGQEFVANAKGVRNPSVRKFLDVFDMAQKNGTIHMINTSQILERVRNNPDNGYQRGGFVQSNGGASGTVDSSVAMALLAENAKAMNRLNDHLDNGIEAHSVISGTYGSYEQTKRYEQLKANASRNS